MKILFLTPYFYPESYSSSFILTDIIVALEKKGHEIIVVAPNPIREVLFKKQGKKSHVTIEHINERTTIHRVYCGFNNQNSKLSRISRLISISKKLPKYSSTLDFDIVIVPSNPPFFLVKNMFYYTKKRKQKIIWNVHDVFPDNTLKNGMLYWFFNKDTKKAIKLVDIIVTLSEDMKDTIVKKVNNEANVRIIGTWENKSNKVSTEANEEFNVRLDDGLINVFYIGNIGEWQGIDTIIKSFKYVNPNVAIHIVGSGRLAEITSLKVKEINSDRLTYTRRVSFETAEKLFSKADANLITLNKNVIRNACPSKTPNALNSKRPIIAAVESDSWFAKKIKLGQGNHVIVPENEKVLADAINCIKKGTDIENDNEFMRFFDRDSNLKKWTDLIDELDKQ